MINYKMIFIDIWIYIYVRNFAQFLHRTFRYNINELIKKILLQICTIVGNFVTRGNINGIRIKFDLSRIKK